MLFLRQYKFALGILALLVFSSVMVVREITLRETRHIELREAFIALFTRGYTSEAQRLCTQLLLKLEQLPTKTLVDDLQRTALLVDTSKHQPDNPLWKYHLSLKRELERRADKSLPRALKLAGE